MRPAAVLLVMVLLGPVLAAGCARPDPVFTCDQAVSWRAASVWVEVRTDGGAFVLELHGDRAPATVCNFLGYAEEGFYDATIFHRLSPGFVIQGGGCSTDYRLKDTLWPPIRNEALASGLENTQGTVAMARTSEPDSATSQFFINLEDNAPLDPGGFTAEGYAVFGRVVSGWDLVESLAATPTRMPTDAERGACYPREPDRPSMPTEPLVVETVRVTSRPA